MRQNALQTSDLVTLYTQQHLTMRQIAPLVGMSPASVSKRLRKVGISASDGERVKVKCGTCGASFERTRKLWKANFESFCTKKCFLEYLANPDFIEWRHGTRIARQVVAQFFDLQPGHVVHHEDSNQQNNDLANLKVFANQSDHLKYHHGKTPVQPLWEGSPCPTPPTRNF